MAGLFFSFDGVDGVGKTTQAELLCQWLSEQGHQVVACRDPGSTALGEAIRPILLDRSDLPIAPRSEMLLYMACRAQLVDELIRPAVEAGKTVVCDRFLLANVVYQGHAGGLDPTCVWGVGEVATGGLLPDLVFLLDLDAAAAGQRIQRDRDRMESRGLDYLRKVRQGFLAEAAARPQQVAVIDAGQAVECVQADIRRAAQPLLNKRRFDR